MSLRQLNNAMCPRAAQRQDIPPQNRTALPQTRLSVQASAAALWPSLFPWGYTPVAFRHEHPTYRNLKLKQEQANSAVRQRWHELLTGFILMPLSSFQCFVKNMTC